MKICKIVLLTFLAINVMACKQANNPLSSPSPAIDNSPLDKSGSPLGFKGLRLGMSKEEFSEKSKLNDFPWMYGHEEKYVEYKPKMDDNWIGCMGEKENKECYYFYPTLIVNWHNDKIVGISIMSLDVTADKINSYVKPWMAFALEILSEKYGAPTKMLFPVGRMNVASFESHRVTYFYKWEKVNERITLGAGEGSSTFYCEIGLEDVKGMTDLEKRKRSNVKSEF